MKGPAGAVLFSLLMMLIICWTVNDPVWLFMGGWLTCFLSSLIGLIVHEHFDR